METTLSQLKQDKALSCRQFSVRQGRAFCLLHWQNASQPSPTHSIRLFTCPGDHWDSRGPELIPLTQPQILLFKHPLRITFTNPVAPPQPIPSRCRPFFDYSQAADPIFDATSSMSTATICEGVVRSLPMRSMPHSLTDSGRPDQTLACMVMAHLAIHPFFRRATTEEGVVGRAT